MREPRAPVLKLVKERPQNSGRFKKELIIELYPARQWSEKYRPGTATRKDCLFLSVEAGQWKQSFLYRSIKAGHFYRLMINGKWYQQDGYRYSFFTEDKAYQLLREMK